MTGIYTVHNPFCPKKLTSYSGLQATIHNWQAVFEWPVIVNTNNSGY